MGLCDADGYTGSDTLSHLHVTLHLLVLHSYQSARLIDNPCERVPCDSKHDGHTFAEVRCVGSTQLLRRTCRHPEALLHLSWQHEPAPPARA